MKKSTSTPELEELLRIHPHLRTRFHQMKIGMIAGNGRFPGAGLEAARKTGMDVVAIGIKEEASPEIEKLASSFHWISLGALSKLIDICKKKA